MVPSARSVLLEKKIAEQSPEVLETTSPLQSQRGSQELGLNTPQGVTMGQDSRPVDPELERTQENHDEADLREGNLLEFLPSETETDLAAEESELEPEIDVRDDPFIIASTSKPDPDWERMIRTVQVRQPDPPGANEQREHIRNILEQIEAQTGEPTEEQASTALHRIQNIEKLILDHKKFVASSF
jgi:hypothetical protein